MKKIHIYADYVCPYCLLAESALEQVVDEEGAEIVWHPFELRRDPVPTLRVEDPYLPTVWERSVYPLAARLGQPIRLPSTSPQPRSNLAFQGFAFAQAQGLGHAYSMQILNAFFVEDRDIGQIEVIVAAGAAVGLDADRLRQALEDGEYEETHASALRHATDEMNISVVPTIMIGDTRIEGMPDIQRVREALRSLPSEEKI